MVVRKNMSNLVIYNKANALLQEFSQLEDMILPVKVHFYLQKNMEKIVSMAQELEKQRMAIIEKYNITSESKQESEALEQANKDIEELFSLEQEVKVYMLPLEWLEEVELNSKQVQAFSFMLECEDEDEEV